MLKTFLLLIFVETVISFFSRFFNEFKVIYDDNISALANKNPLSSYYLLTEVPETHGTGTRLVTTQ